eukprot:jgi/Psemu1/53926/gm1.53926_g
MPCLLYCSDDQADDSNSSINSKRTTATAIESAARANEDDSNSKQTTAKAIDSFFNYFFQLPVQLFPVSAIAFLPMLPTSVCYSIAIPVTVIRHSNSNRNSSSESRSGNSGTAILHSNLAQQSCTAILHSNLAQQSGTAIRHSNPPQQSAHSSPPQQSATAVRHSKDRKIVGTTKSTTARATATTATATGTQHAPWQAAKSTERPQLGQRINKSLATTAANATNSGTEQAQQGAGERQQIICNNNNGIQNNNKSIASKSNEAKSKEETWEDITVIINNPPNLQPLVRDKTKEGALNWGWKTVGEKKYPSAEAVSIDSFKTLDSTDKKFILALAESEPSLQICAKASRQFAKQRLGKLESIEFTRTFAGEIVEAKPEVVRGKKCTSINNGYAIIGTRPNQLSSENGVYVFKNNVDLTTKENLELTALHIVKEMQLCLSPLAKFVNLEMTMMNEVVSHTTLN